MDQVHALAQVSATLPTQATQKPATANVAPSGLRFVLINRPAAGNGSGYLAAHTAAVFAALGLFEGASVPKAHLIRAWGQSAWQYHQGSKGGKHAGNPAFDDNGDTVSLNDAGFDRFGVYRNVSDDKATMFLALLTQGKADDAPRAFQAVKPV